MSIAIVSDLYYVVATCMVKTQIVWIAGNYPEWDEDHPVHFVGHSAGAQVIRLLQQMLADKVRNC